MTAITFGRQGNCRLAFASVSYLKLKQWEAVWGCLRDGGERRGGPRRTHSLLICFNKAWVFQKAKGPHLPQHSWDWPTDSPNFLFPIIQSEPQMETFSQRLCFRGSPLVPRPWMKAEGRPSLCKHVSPPSPSSLPLSSQEALPGSTPLTLLPVLLLDCLEIVDLHTVLFLLLLLTLRLRNQSPKGQCPGISSPSTQKVIQEDGSHMR